MKTSSYLALIFSLLVISCNNSQQYEIRNTDKYEKTKAILAKSEQDNPSRFIVVEGNNKKNLFGQTVIRGRLFNNARIVTYKDIDIKLSFFSKTGALLEEDHEIVYETIHPGAHKSFKSKYFAPKGTDSIVMKVITAKF